MAQILAPGVAQSSLSGLYGGQPWTLVWHWAFDNQTGNWGSTQIQQLADAISAQWGTYASPRCSASVTLQGVTTVDLGNPTPSTGSNGTAHVGTNAGGAIANTSMAAMMSFKINARYKGGHPRSYLPWGTTTDTLNQFQWNTAFATASQQAMANIASQVRASIGAVNGAQVSHVCPRYAYTVQNDSIHQKYVRTRSGYKGTFVVNSYLLNPTFGVQRRRLRL